MLVNAGQYLFGREQTERQLTSEWEVFCLQQLCPSGDTGTSWKVFASSYLKLAKCRVLFTLEHTITTLQTQQCISNYIVIRLYLSQIAQHITAIYITISPHYSQIGYISFEFINRNHQTIYSLYYKASRLSVYVCLKLANNNIINSIRRYIFFERFCLLEFIKFCVFTRVTGDFVWSFPLTDWSLLFTYDMEDKSRNIYRRTIESCAKDRKLLSILPFQICNYVVSCKHVLFY